MSSLSSLWHCVRRFALSSHPTMPSLRRTASSPAVRSSPYSSGSPVARGGGHRRSSGSETTNRRVLADIEWWRVTEGQRESSPDQEVEDRIRGNQDIVNFDMSLGAGGIHITHVVDATADSLSPLPLPWTPALAVVSDEVCVFLFAPAFTDSHPVVVELKSAFQFIRLQRMLFQQNSSLVSQSPHIRRHAGTSSSLPRPPWSQRQRFRRPSLKVLPRACPTWTWAS